MFLSFKYFLKIKQKFAAIYIYFLTEIQRVRKRDLIHSFPDSQTYYIRYSKLDLNIEIISKNIQLVNMPKQTNRKFHVLQPLLFMVFIVFFFCPGYFCLIQALWRLTTSKTAGLTE